MGHDRSAGLVQSAVLDVRSQGILQNRLEMTAILARDLAHGCQQFR